MTSVGYNSLNKIGKLEPMQCKCINESVESLTNIRVFSIPLHKILTNYRGEKQESVMEKPSRYNLNQVIKVNIICNLSDRNHAPPTRMQ